MFSACWFKPDRKGCLPAKSRHKLGISPNKLTFHFDKLREAGLVTVRREGRSMIYAARYDAMNALLGYLTENCCQGADANCAAPACEPTTVNKASEGTRMSKPIIPLPSSAQARWAWLPRPI